MQKNEFIKKIKDELEIEEDISLSSDLNDFPEYDSLAVLSLIALIDESFGVSLSAVQFKSITTVESLIDLIGKEHFEL